MADIKTDRGPGVRFPPPLIFILFMLLGFGLESLWPLDMGLTGLWPYFGVLLVLMVLVIVFRISRAFNKANTRIEPWQPTSAIITSGIYAYSRNPIYIAFCSVSVGIGIYANSVWVLMSFLPAAVVTNYYVILKEERYLESVFGEQYLQYKNNVRRWL